MLCSTLHILKIGEVLRGHEHSVRRFILGQNVHPWKVNSKTWNCYFHETHHIWKVTPFPSLCKIRGDRQPSLFRQMSFRSPWLNNAWYIIAIASWLFSWCFCVQHTVYLHKFCEKTFFDRWYLLKPPWLTNSLMMRK